MPKFKLTTEYKPQGDQPKAIQVLSENILAEVKHQVLLGVTGSGKTFTMANVVAQVQKPTLVIAPNKTLAAQLFSEFRSLFPENAIQYFVSYYDYYQPEAYLPATDTYIAKDSAINEEIDKLRHAATYSLLEREDVLIVASVSCIYGLGSPEAYYGLLLTLDRDMAISRQAVIRKLVEIQYTRNDIDFHRGVFRVRGDIVDIFPAYESEKAVRIEFFGDTVENICEIDPLRGRVLRSLNRVTIYPGSHYVTFTEDRTRAMKAIKEELKDRIEIFRLEGKLIEAQRIEERTNYDLQMMLEIGYCTGVENYSRHLTNRVPGQPPPTLLDYFPKDFLLFIDESHITVPQVRGMYRGDRSRKGTLVEFGFRLPSALDNRPLNFEEFAERVNQVVYVSATPADYELNTSPGMIIEQVIRPTGLMDPEIIHRPADNQVDDLLEEIRLRVAKDERVLVTTLTKRMSEDLTDYYSDLGIRVKYLHSDIKTIERMEIIRELRLGEFDVLIGINLLREGLDIPEVSLVAILDADKEGFLRSARSLIQTCGRAARNVNGRVILYGNVQTESMRLAMEETSRRRQIQGEYNREHNITPETIKKDINDVLSSLSESDYVTVPVGDRRDGRPAIENLSALPGRISKLRKEMLEAADNLEFERAAELRDRIKDLEQIELALG
ncbi:MAG: excinuclease ABC subunit UvrB [Deltaproteobacteria bacterium]|nr:excinuclease ABC subunit UvrB [Deltaproteobacteria bacterium]